MWEIIGQMPHNGKNLPLPVTNTCTHTRQFNIHTHNLWIYTSHKYNAPYVHMWTHTHLSDLHTWPVTYSALTSDFFLSAPLLKLPWISHWLVSTIVIAERKIPAHCLFFCPACLIAACQNDVSEQSTLLTCLTASKCAYVIQGKKKHWTCWQMFKGVNQWSDNWKCWKVAIVVRCQCLRGKLSDCQ